MPYQTDFFAPGTTVNLPELAGYAEAANNEFSVIAIHEGGMGACIHLHHKTTSKHFALKSIRPDLLGDDSTFDQFINELGLWVTASACDAVVEAISVVKINEVPSVLQPWMMGGDLSTALPNLNSERRFQILLRVVRGLKWIYENQGVIHCDLKPSNILLDKSGIAMVADWGLARPLSAGVNKAYKRSSDERVIKAQQKLANGYSGTILYSSPEQILSPSSIDHRADIYALGCIMYELETGSPPFTGSSFWEIARKQVEEKPPKFGGLFSKTLIGLEKVIETCLDKQPRNRFAGYNQLEDALMQVAKKRNYSLRGCEVAERYQRYTFGSGTEHQKSVHEKAKFSSKGYGVISIEQSEPFMVEAINLMSVGKYQDAAKLLEPYVIPRIIEEPNTWNFGHKLAEAYASALLHIPDKRQDAFIIYGKLERMSGKPVEFYVNCSLAYLVDKQPAKTATLCEEGLLLYPKDVSVIGNQTLAYLMLNDYEKAAASAHERLRIRRDVHAISEFVAVHFKQIRRLRYSDLPKAMEMTKVQFALLSEGLKINPRFVPLLLQEIEMLCFIGEPDKAMLKFSTINESNNVGISIKNQAFLTLIDYMSDTKDYRLALDLIERFRPAFVGSDLQERLDYYKNKISVNHFVLVNYKSSERKVVLEINDFFLRKVDGAYQYPVMAARILDWMGDTNAAMSLLLTVATSWEARKHLALMKQRNGCKNEAYHWAQELIFHAPWKSESYDVYSYIAKQEGDFELESKLKKQADAVYEKELEIFDSLRDSLS